MITDLEVTTPADLAEEVPTIVARAKELIVTTPDSYAGAGDFLKAIKGAANRVAAFFKPTKQKIDEAKRAVLDMERQLSAPLSEAERLTKAAMLGYQHEQERKAEAERRRLQAIADETARREREALEKKAAAAKKPETQQRYAEQAAQVTAPVVAVANVAAKVEGVNVRKVWKADITDLSLFLAHAFDTRRADLVLPNLKILDALAKGLKEQASIPGVRFFAESQMAASGR